MKQEKKGFDTGRGLRGVTRRVLIEHALVVSGAVWSPLGDPSRWSPQSQESSRLWPLRSGIQGELVAQH